MGVKKRRIGWVTAVLVGLGALAAWRRRCGTVQEERGDHAEQSTTSDLHHDPLGLLDHLRGTGRFCRDTVLGGMLHWGEVSLRETSHENSLHVTLSGNRLTAHIDRLSPLVHEHSSWIARYSVTRSVAHTLAHLLDAAGRLLHGRGGEHRLDLTCERRERAEDQPPDGWADCGSADDGHADPGTDRAPGDERPPHTRGELGELVGLGSHSTERRWAIWAGSRN